MKPVVKFYGRDQKGRERSSELALESGEWISPARWAELCRNLGGRFPVEPHRIVVHNKSYDLKAYHRVCGVDTLSNSTNAGIRCRAQKSVDGKIKMRYQINWR